MKKNLINILFSTIFSALSLLNGCGAPYKESLNYENLDQGQKQFVDNMHKLYGPQVSYKEMRNHVKDSLGKYQADIVNHFLKDYVKKENCWENIEDKALVGIYEGMKKLD